MSPRAVALQGVGSPPLAIASQGFVGAFIYVPLLAILVLAEFRGITLGSARFRTVRIPSEARGIRIPADPELGSETFGGGILVRAEPRHVTVAGDFRLILMPS